MVFYRNFTICHLIFQVCLESFSIFNLLNICLVCHMCLALIYMLNDISYLNGTSCANIDLVNISLETMPKKATQCSNPPLANSFMGYSSGNRRTKLGQGLNFELSICVKFSFVWTELNLSVLSLVGRELCRLSGRSVNL